MQLFENDGVAIAVPSLEKAGHTSIVFVPALGKVTNRIVDVTGDYKEF
jgi:hypothetical protein